MDLDLNITPQRDYTEQQKINDLFATGLSKLFGANVVSQTEYDRVIEENRKASIELKNISDLRLKLLKTQCKLLGFASYHRKWKPTTRRFERRLKKLQKEKLFIDFSKFPRDIAVNLKEAYQCYLNGLYISCYIMILRTIEISVAILYSKNHEKEYDKNGKEKFIPVLQKLNWISNEKIIGGADFTIAKGFIEARNESMHNIYSPTDKQVLSAFEMVIKLIEKLK